jgi:hypothetical protein
MDGGGVNLDEQQISHQYIASIFDASLTLAVSASSPLQP